MTDRIPLVFTLDLVMLLACTIHLFEVETAG